ncbi:hypothetical protein [Staphylococcus aureus]
MPTTFGGEPKNLRHPFIIKNMNIITGIC